MRYSQSLIRTTKEAPKDAIDISHILLMRGGYIRMLAAGIYELLPLGQRVLKRVTEIVREELDAHGAQELLLPILLPATLFQETGRWDVYGDVLMRLKDRRGGDYHLGPTHEETVTDLLRREVNSYKRLPQTVYQIQMKYRDEARPRAGLMRGREFLMMDAYSFDADFEGAHKSYAKMREAYHGIFQRLGLDYRIVEADSGQMGGDTSAEFQVLAQSGEDKIAACDRCDYAANLEVAVAAAKESAEGQAKPLERVATPGVKTIEEVARFFEVTPQETLKSILFAQDGKLPEGEKPRFALALVRGDRDINELQVARALGVESVRMASDEEVQRELGTKPGFVGPLHVPEGVSVFMDHEVAAIPSLICGAGDGHHYVGASAGRDFQAEVKPLGLVVDGDRCQRCGGELKTYRGIEGGHIFVLGTHYSAKMNATFLDAQGESRPFVMGCYGIGMTRLIAAIIEQHHDDEGIVWPISVAPFEVIVLSLGKEEEAAAEAERIYAALRAAGVDALYDDRPERPGVKFKDADLLGIPLRVTVGARALAEGEVEFKARGGEQTRVKAPEIVAHVVAEVAARKAARS